MRTLSFGGCFTAMWILKKFDYDRPLLLTFFLMVLAVGLLASTSPRCSSLAWRCSTSCGSLSTSTKWAAYRADRRAARRLHSWRSGFGSNRGPFAASIMLDLGWGFDGVFVLCAGPAGALLIYTMIYLKWSPNHLIGYP